jgi:hypothetical protein
VVAKKPQARPACKNPLKGTERREGEGGSTETSHMIDCFSGYFRYVYALCSFFELVDSAVLLNELSAVRLKGDIIVFLNLTTIIYQMAALATIYDVTGKSLVSAIYS